jgi:hypothetical protein
MQSADNLQWHLHGRFQQLSQGQLLGWGYILAQTGESTVEWLRIKLKFDEK